MSSSRSHSKTHFIYGEILGLFVGLMLRVLIEGIPPDREGRIFVASMVTLMALLSWCVAFTFPPKTGAAAPKDVPRASDKDVPQGRGAPRDGRF
jgi:hypothetical protein